MNRYAIADLHGQLDLLRQVKEYLHEDDVLYILGDSGDRGPQPWATLKMSLDDPQFIYLMGNHDLMLLDAIDTVLKEGDEALMHLYNRVNSRDPIGICYLNGGLSTLEGWIADPDRERYYQKLRMAPLEVRLAAFDRKHFIYLTHAGYSPHLYNALSVEDMVWDRQHFFDDPAQDGSLLIHGHTPIEAVVKKFDNAKNFDKFYNYDLSQGYLSYANRTKIDIDVGACFYNETILLNIDTLEGIKFITQGEDVDGAQSK